MQYFKQSFNKLSLSLWNKYWLIKNYGGVKMNWIFISINIKYTLLINQTVKNIKMVELIEPIFLLHLIHDSKKDLWLENMSTLIISKDQQNICEVFVLLWSMMKKMASWKEKPKLLLKRGRVESYGLSYMMFFKPGTSISILRHNSF